MCNNFIINLICRNKRPSNKRWSLTGWCQICLTAWELSHSAKIISVVWLDVFIKGWDWDFWHVHFIIWNILICLNRHSWTVCLFLLEHSAQFNGFQIVATTKLSQGPQSRSFIGLNIIKWIYRTNLRIRRCKTAAPLTCKTVLLLIQKQKKSLN